MFIMVVKKISCNNSKYTYSHAVAFNEYKKNLIDSRKQVYITKEQITSINDIIAPLMIHKHHSVNHIYSSHSNLLPFSKSTFYKYINLSIVNINDLQRKVKYRVKKDYNYTREKVNTKIKVGRFYTDFKDYLKFHPNCSIVEMDTVIGSSGGKDGNCFFTILFRQYNLMLIYLLPYKRSEYVTQVFNYLKELLGIDEFKRLFEAILTDNATEFSDPNCSWQKGSIEKNHEYIRYILPKGTSFAGLTQEDCNLIASHINSISRQSLNNISPYETAFILIGNENLNKLKIDKINYDDIDLTIKLLKK